jgi:undecaprenyl-diphosphatase
MKKRNIKNKEIAKSDYVILVLLLIIPIAIFILMLLSIQSNNSISILDNEVHQSMQGIFSEKVIYISKIITNVFDPLIFVIISFLIIIYLFYKKRSKEALFFTIILIVAQGLLSLIKNIVHRLRPQDILVSETSFSFPSGHAMMSVVFFGIVIYLFEHHIKSDILRKILIALIPICSLIIGATRIILNAHWLSDVIAGYMLGAFLVISYLLMLMHIDIFKTN